MEIIPALFPNRLNKNKVMMLCRRLILLKRNRVSNRCVQQVNNQLHLRASAVNEGALQWEWLKIPFKWNARFERSELMWVTEMLCVCVFIWEKIPEWQLSPSRLRFSNHKWLVVSSSTTLNWNCKRGQDAAERIVGGLTCFLPPVH